MIEKEYGKYNLICDICYETVYGLETWQDVLDTKRELEWKTKIIDGKRIDICPDCPTE